MVDKKDDCEWEMKLNDLSVDVMVEEEVIISNSVRRYVDIVVLISPNNENDESVVSSGKGNSLVFAIENKIRDSASKESQLQEQLEGLKESYKDSEIYFLYLTPNKKDNFQKAYSHLPDDMTKSHLSWSEAGTDESEMSIVKILRDILEDDLKAKINPLSTDLKFIIKSFIVFADNDFRSTSTKRANSINRTGNKYFKGTVTGLEGVEELLESAANLAGKQVYIGYLGGETSLLQQEYDLLVNRSFKWDDKLTSKQKGNWIPIETFIQITKNMKNL